VKKYTDILIFIGLALTIYWWFNRQPSLVQLQQKYLAAKDDGDRNRVIDQLEKYYLHLSVEDSIRKRIEQNVAAVVDTSNPDLSDFDDGWDSSDISALETRLKELLKAAMIVCAQSSPQEYAAFLQYAQERAAFVDGKTQHQYWSAVVKRMKVYPKKEALAYLRAVEAAALCADWINSNYQAAEQSGALALQYQLSISNERLRLEVMQRMQFILFLYRNLNELSIALGERTWSAAEKIGDYLRVAGLLCNQAEAYNQNGEIEKVLERCQRIQNLSEEHSNISTISFYRKKGLPFIAEAYWRLGNFEKALSVIIETERLPLRPEVVIVLQDLKGLVYESMGNYEAAESAFKQAVAMADSSNFLFNRILFRIHLGNLYNSLTEYELASPLYKQVFELLSEFDLEQSGLFIDALSNANLAILSAEEKDLPMIQSLLQQANRMLIGVKHPPLLEARLLHTIGQLHFAIREYRNALEAFRSAEKICDQTGLLAYGWNNKIFIAKTLVCLHEFNLANKKAQEAFLASKESKKDEKLIESLGLMAQIEYLKGNLIQAINISNQLIHAIENVSVRFVHSNRLAAFRQKTYDYLKQAVVYEIYRNQLDSAVIKLDYAKSRTLRHVERFGNGNSKYFLNLDFLKSNLGENQVVLDYILTSDTMYTFAITTNDLVLLKRRVDLADMKKNVYDLLGNINQTITVFKNYDATSNRRHYIENTKLARSLFEKLMGWSEFETIMKNVKLIYIVPDEFLCQVPFATLVVDTTKEVRYLAEKAALSYLPAVSFLQPSKMANPAHFRNKRILISANPDIPGVSDLIAFLQKTFPLSEEMQTDLLPTKQKIIKNLSEGHDIYIVVGHGSANPTDVERSQMEFAIKNTQTGSSETIPLTLADLRQVNWLGVEMVMLVGCETGIGKVYRGTGMIGLQQWLAAMGSENVLGSQWKVDAVQTLNQIEHFIRIWLENDNTPLALQKVQMAIIQKLREHKYFKFPHPYYWGANSLICKNGKIHNSLQ